jgi:thioredoxin 1
MNFLCSSTKSNICLCDCYLQYVAEDWAVEAMPTFVFLKESKLVDKVVGAKKEELERTIANHAIASASASA